MVISIMQRVSGWLNKRSPLRTYQLFTLLSLLAIVAYVSLGNPLPTSSYSADGWAQMSITIGASILTLIAIIAAIGMSTENNRRREFNENLTAILNKIDDKKRRNPDKSLGDIYENSKHKIQDVIESVPPLKFTESMMGIMGFFLFLFSALFAILGTPFYFTIGFFLYGIAILVGYVLYVVEEFANMDKFSFVKKKNGSLSLLDVRVNGIHKEFELGKKEITLALNREIRRIEFKVRCEGRIRNGFLHATVKYSNELVSFIPDSNTFLANYGFVDDYHLTLLEKEFDTGILQIDNRIDLSFEVVLRSNKETDENPLIGIGFIERLGEKKIFKHCSLTDNFLVKSIELRIYEDPLYKPNFKRREIDCIILTLSEPEP